MAGDQSRERLALRFGAAGIRRRERGAPTPEFDAYPTGVPLWADLCTRDTRIAVRFYSSLFGWTAEDLDPGADSAPFERSYRMTRQDGKVVAGIGPLLVEPGASAWSTYIGVADIDETIRRARAAGAQVLNAGPKGTMATGRLGVILDPSGAMVSLWQPGQQKAAPLANEVRTSSWNELNTRNAQVSEEFYSTVFGWEAEASSDQMPYTVWKLDGRSIGGMQQMPPETAALRPSRWITYFSVADTDATAQTALSLSRHELVADPMDTPRGRVAVIADPVGAEFAVISVGAGAGPDR